MDLSTLLFGLFAAATGVQIAFWWGVFARLAWFKQPASPPAPGPAAIPVSVIICARNEAQNLERYLPCVLEQNYPVFEVLVVDDDSDDGTQQILLDFQKKYARLRVLRVAPKTTPGKKYALEQGIAAARYEHLVLTDADCQPASLQWLCTMTKYWTPDTEIVLGYAPHRSEPGFLNRCIRFETAHTAMLYFSFALAGWPYMGVGRNLAWRKDIFQRIGGFKRHAHLPSGDDDLLVNAAAHRGNTAVCLAPATFMYSAGKKTWRDWLQQKRRQLGAGNLYRRKHQFALGLFAGTQILHYFLLIPLMVSDFGMISGAIYALRITSASLIFSKILRQFHDERLYHWFPLLDLLLVFYSAVFVPLFLVRSNYLISWK